MAETEQGTSAYRQCAKAKLQIPAFQLNSCLGFFKYLLNGGEEGQRTEKLEFGVILKKRSKISNPGSFVSKSCVTLVM